MIDTEDFISHYGKKGMKWGVRKARPSVKSKTARTSYKKAPKRLSDAELSKRIKRMELEKKYNDLNPETNSSGKDYSRALLQNTGKTVVGGVVGTATSFAVQRALKNKFG